jgi:hypothetical protein
MRILITLFFALLVGGGGTFLWIYFGGFDGEKDSAIAFIDTYGEYTEVAQQVENLVYLPGTEGNVHRSDLLALLNSILTEQLEAGRREELARLAFTNLDAIKKEIDSAQVAQAKLYQVLQDLDNTGRMFTSIELRNQVDEMVLLARKRAEVSSRITAILSETNEHTYAIITRIIAEKGVLSQEHIAEINTATAEAEERFSTLEGLYTEVLVKKEEMDTLFKKFVATAI